jgi:hypothetical protein
MADITAVAAAETVKVLAFVSILTAPEQPDPRSGAKPTSLAFTFPPFKLNL